MIVIYLFQNRLNNLELIFCILNHQRLWLIFFHDKVIIKEISYTHLDFRYDIFELEEGLDIFYLSTVFLLK